MIDRIDGLNLFGNLVFANTFQYSTESDTSLIAVDLNQKQFAKQSQAPIQVIITNPPWSAGKKDASDETSYDLNYEQIQQRIQSTYVKRHQEATKRSAGGSASG